MDPVSAAGIGLSVTSLTFQLFSGCVKGYQLLLDARDMPNKLEHIRIRMRLEQIRLLSWGDKIGLLNDVLEGPSQILRLHHNLIVDVLLEISQLFTACLNIENKFTSTALSTLASQYHHKLGIATSSQGQQINKLLTKAMSTLRRSSELPHRIEWAMVKQDKFEKLVEQLISYNNSMLSLLDVASLNQISQTQVQCELTLLQMSSKIGDLEDLTRAVQIRPAKDRSAILTRSPSPSSTHQIPLNTRHYTSQDDFAGLAHLAMFKADSLGPEYRYHDVHSLEINVSEVHIDQSSSRIDTGIFRDHAVWIEWKEFDHQSRNPWYKDVLENRVKKLAKLLSMNNLPEEFRGPTCLGYIHETDDEIIRYGFVNKIPAGVSNTSPPTSLLELIRHQQSPSLSRRVRLAGILATGLMYLHSVNWLHKGFRSENIIFFSREEAHANHDVPVIAGFEYARPDEQGELTEKPESIIEHDIYRHPYCIEHPQARSQKSWDIYSLGIVLIEIALWKSINRIAGIDFRDHKAKSKVRRIREFLLADHFMDQIGIACGDRYQEVVSRCVTGGVSVGVGPDADETDPVVGSDMIRVFSRDIVDVLMGIQV